MFFFSVLYFNYSSANFVIVANGEAICYSQWTCFAYIANYGLRGNAYWEDIFWPVLNLTRFLIDTAFFLVVLNLTFNLVFGIILDAFADLRDERNALERQIRDRCFICDIERARFDLKANEGISFEKHIKQEHYLWNYVFFLIYLYKKK